MRPILAAVLLLPLAAAAAPLSRPAAQACLDEVMRTAAPVVKAGPACTALLARIRTGGDGIPGDADLAQALGELGADALRDFAATLQDANAPGVRPRADPSGVAAILAGLPDPSARPLSFWERVDAWVRRLLSPAQSGPAPTMPAWLLRLVESLRYIPPVAVKGTVLFLFALLVASLIWVVVRELRVAGIWLRRRRKTRKPASPPLLEIPPVALMEALPQRDRPAALLRWVIGRLVERGLLPADAALTNRELQGLLPATVRPLFGDLTVVAERAYFGDARPAAAEMDQALELAQTLTRAEASA